MKLWNLTKVIVAKRRKEKEIKKFLLAPMGVLALGSAHARPSALPPSTLAEIFRHTCLQSHLQKHLKSHIRSFGTLGQLLKIPTWTPKYMIERGGMGGPQLIFFGWNPSSFDSSEPMQNFGTLQQFLNLPPLSPQICDSAGGPQLFSLDWNPNICVT
jgi:hypothetical protein